MSDDQLLEVYGFAGLGRAFQYIRAHRTEASISLALGGTPSLRQQVKEFYGAYDASVAGLGTRQQWALRDLDRRPDETPPCLPLLQHVHRDVHSGGGPMSNWGFEYVREDFQQDPHPRGCAPFFSLLKAAGELDAILEAYKFFEAVVPLFGGEP